MIIVRIGNGPQKNLKEKLNNVIFIVGFENVRYVPRNLENYTHKNTEDLT